MSVSGRACISLTSLSLTRPLHPERGASPCLPACLCSSLPTTEVLRAISPTERDGEAARAAQAGTGLMDLDLDLDLGLGLGSALSRSRSRSMVVRL